MIAVFRKKKAINKNESVESYKKCDRPDPRNIIRGRNIGDRPEEKEIEQGDEQAIMTDEGRKKVNPPAKVQRQNHTLEIVKSDDTGKAPADAKKHLAAPRMDKGFFSHKE